VVLTTRASDLSGLRCRPFCSYHCLVHSARMDSPVGVLSVRMARWSCMSACHGILVIPYAMVSDDVGDQAAVDCKQQRAKHRSLRDAHVNFSDMWFMLAHLDELGGSGNGMTGTTVRLWNNCKTEWWRPKSWFWGQAKATVSESKSFSFFYLQWNFYSLRVSAA